MIILWLCKETTFRVCCDQSAGVAKPLPRAWLGHSDLWCHTHLKRVWRGLLHNWYDLGDMTWESKTRLPSRTERARRLAQGFLVPVRGRGDSGSPHTNRTWISLWYQRNEHQAFSSDCSEGRCRWCLKAVKHHKNESDSITGLKGCYFCSLLSNRSEKNILFFWKDKDMSNVNI